MASKKAKKYEQERYNKYIREEEEHMEEKVFKKGDIIEYGFFVNITINEVKEDCYVLIDKNGNKKEVDKDMFNKYAKFHKSVK